MSTPLLTHNDILPSLYLDADASKICYKCKKAGHTSRECPEQADQSERSKVDSRGERETLEKVNMEEDDIHEIGEEEKEKLNDVDYLTGNPLPNDVLLYAVPMCGPYNALQSYKYRVKIIPGSLKKGKGMSSKPKQYLTFLVVFLLSLKNCIYYILMQRPRRL